MKAPVPPAHRRPRLSKHGFPGAVSPRYKWIALSNTTVAVLRATIDSSIMLIAMPQIFHGIRLNPLEPRNTLYLLWMILGYQVVSSVLVVSLGRLGDMFGRVRMYNLGFIVYTAASLALTIDPYSGQAGALWLVIGRIFQGVGAAFLVANSGAILTDAFPPDQRGLALGINNVADISGSFLGLILGGVLAAIHWRLVFLVSVPFGIFGTLSTFLSAVGRGGSMFMLIIWLQGIWLPLHGYSFEETPPWAGIFMLPLSVGSSLGRQPRGSRYVHED